MPKVIFLLGTTASGKSELALKLAAEFSGVIVNADSVQMYRDLDIGSAKPTKKEMSMVPHFLFGFARAPDSITVGDYHRRFFSLMKELSEKLVIVVGGTGFYFQALEKGLPQVPISRVEFQEPLFKAWKNDPAQALVAHQFLKSRDSVAAARIHFNDHYRLARALDLMDATGKSVTQVWEEHRQLRGNFPYPLLKLGLQGRGPELELKVRQRTQKMLELGLIQETRDLLAQGFAQWDPLQSIGYKEVCQYLMQGQTDQKSLENEIVQKTLRLAKKQRTWFQRDPEIQWLVHDQESNPLTRAKGLIQNFLKDAKATS